MADRGGRRRALGGGEATGADGRGGGALGSGDASPAVFYRLADESAFEEKVRLHASGRRCEAAGRAA